MSIKLNHEQASHLYQGFTVTTVTLTAQEVKDRFINA